ncbi:Imm58 family immunity protein [Citrobacter amalonaticus]|uniref:Imm58 family immunity protein n=1 Tax=Citrobacter amalonaticus TaxID=35703 RepID=UPI00374A6312
MKFKIILIISIISVLSNIFLLYDLIDRSISLSYSRQSVDNCSNDLSLLTAVVKGELNGKNKKYIEQKFMGESLNDSLLIKNNVMYLGNTEFIFNDGILIDVK